MSIHEQLLAAIENDDVDIALDILKEYTPDNRNRHENPLFYAVVQGNSKILNALINKGMDTSVVNDDGETLLWVAAFNGRLELVDILIDSGAHIDELSGYFGAPALFAAIERGHIDIIQKLLDLGASTDITSEEYGLNLFEFIDDIDIDNKNEISNLINNHIKC